MADAILQAKAILDSAALKGEIQNIGSALARLKSQVAATGAGGKIGPTFDTRGLNQFQSGIGALQGGIGGLLGSIGQLAKSPLFVGGAIVGGIGLLAKQIMDAENAFIKLADTLGDTSARTNVAVKDLFILRTVFQDIGISGDAVGGLLNKMQKALAGADEQGKGTRKTFEDLGLDMDALASKSAIEQFTAIIAALKQVDQNKRALAVEKIFGKGGLRTICSPSSATRRRVGCPRRAGWRRRRCDTARVDARPPFVFAKQRRQCHWH